MPIAGTPRREVAPLLGSSGRSGGACVPCFHTLGRFLAPELVLGEESDSEMSTIEQGTGP